MEGTERLAGRVRETVVPGFEKMYKRDTWIKEGAGQPDCWSRITEDGDGRGTSVKAQVRDLRFK